MKTMWDERFSGDEYVYGKEPNEFIRQTVSPLKPGRALLLGEGEGRNAVYLAKCGWKVDAVDYSEKGKEKAMRLAEEQNVKINYTIMDVRDFIPQSVYDFTGYSFLHLPEKQRIEIHKKMIDSLTAGGGIAIEAFSKEQINFKTGGPKNPALLYSLDEIVEDFQDLEFIHLSREIRELNNGINHKGEASVIRFSGIKK